MPKTVTIKLVVWYRAGRWYKNVGRKLFSSKSDVKHLFQRSGDGV